MSTGYAWTAVEEMKQSGEWDAEEDGLACFADEVPKDPANGSPARTLILMILRGETPEGIFIYFAPKYRTTRVNVEEVKRQIKAHFRSDERYDWPAAFTIEEFREKFPRTFSGWSAEEERCYAVMIASGKSRSELAEIFQRAPGAALVPPNAVSPPHVTPDRAINLLGVEVRCNKCYHAPPLTYAVLAHAAMKAGAEALTFSKSELAGRLGLFRCKRCGTKGTRLKVED